MSRFCIALSMFGMTALGCVAASESEDKLAVQSAALLRCDYDHRFTAYENNCPQSYNGSGDGCDCFCQFNDPDCNESAGSPASEPAPIPLYDCNQTFCTYLWCGTPYGHACPEAWNGANDGCDCGCQFLDSDCGN